MNTYEKRNIAEQVEKNKQDILKHFQRDEVLADFGIRIIGQLESAEELPATAENYGDAYAVGTKSPFNYYIWTRANNISPVDYWFEFGEIAIAGPQGPKGDRGEKGATGESTYWISTFTLDYLDLEEQDIPIATMVLEYSSGNVYQVQIVNGVKTFNYQMNIKGATGAQGPRGPKGDPGAQGPKGDKGDTGDVGGFINIGGIVASEYELPDPEQVQNLTVAFLVGSAEPYNLYIQVGSNSAVAEWMDMGPLNVATLVTVGGQFQNTWDADTKVDSIPLAQVSGSLVYIRDHLGVDSYRTLSANPLGGAIPVYNRSSTNQGVLKTGTPEADNDCVNLAYFSANAGGSHWTELSIDQGMSNSQSGVFNFPTEVQGHLINLMIEVDYHRFSDWSDKNSTVFGPVSFRLPGRNLKGMSATVNGNTSDTEILNQKIELSSSYYGDIGFSYAPIQYRITKDGSMDYYTPEFHVYYQDLGPSFTVNP